MVNLSDKQQLIVDLVQRGHNVYFRGIASCGKTFVAKHVLDVRDMSTNARNGEFGNFDEISRKINIRGKSQRAIELEIGVPTKRQF